MENEIIFWAIYFGGLISVFLLGMKIGYGLPKKPANLDRVCIDGVHHFVSNGSPNGTVICQRCGLLEV